MKKRRTKRILRATYSESLSLATKSELEIESRLKSEDAAPMATTVGANRQAIAASANSEVLFFIRRPIGGSA